MKTHQQKHGETKAESYSLADQLRDFLHSPVYRFNRALTVAPVCAIIGAVFTQDNEGAIVGASVGYALGFVGGLMTDPIRYIAKVIERSAHNVEVGKMSHAERTDFNVPKVNALTGKPSEGSADGSEGYTAKD